MKELSDDVMKRLFEDILKVYKPGADVDELLTYVENLDDWHLMGIASRPSGKKADDNSEYLPSYIEEEWVNQYQDGGYSGDDYAGYTYLKLADDAWLMFNYYM